MLLPGTNPRPCLPPTTRVRPCQNVCQKGQIPIGEWNENQEWNEWKNEKGKEMAYMKGEGGNNKQAEQKVSRDGLDGGARAWYRWDGR